jgi:hypothetical protein
MEGTPGPPRQHIDLIFLSWHFGYIGHGPGCQASPVQSDL